MGVSNYNEQPPSPSGVLSAVNAAWIRCVCIQCLYSMHYVFTRYVLCVRSVYNGGASGGAWWGMVRMHSITVWCFVVTIVAVDTNGSTMALMYWIDSTTVNGSS